MKVSAEPRFSTRVGLLLSVLGIAVGTGNIWRFPRIAAQNGGETGAGAFLVAWAVCLVVWSVPLIIAEYAVGRTARAGVVAAFVRMGGPKRAWMGAFVGLVACAIMFYYSVVAGWCVYYLVQTVGTDLPTTTPAAMGVWEDFQASNLPLVFHALAIGLGALAVRKGVRSIERLNRVLIPILLGIVVCSLIRALTLDGSLAGVRYLFRADWAQLAQPRIWLEALTQNAWDTGAGWGLILTYAAYMRSRDSVVKNACITGAANNAVSLIAAMTVFGTVFAVLGTQMSHGEILEVMRDSGPASTGLTFIWMPQLFATMPAGRIVGVGFFLALSFAALTSLVSMIELAVRVLVDFGISRSRAVAVTTATGFVLGIPSASYLGLLGNQDFVWGVGLMLSGLAIALLVVHYGPDRLRAEIRGIPGDWDPGKAWIFAVTYVVPTLTLALLGFWLYVSATRYARETWWDPLDPFSVATCILQWGLAGGGLLVANAFLVRKLRRGLSPDSPPPDVR